MSRPLLMLLLWFGLAIALTQVMGWAFERSHTRRPTNTDADQALQIGPRNPDVSCDACTQP